MTYSGSFGFPGSSDSSVSFTTDKKGEICMTNRVPSLVFPAGTFHGGESLPTGTFHGGESLPTGTFHGGESLPTGTFHGGEVLPTGTFHGGEALPTGTFHGVVVFHSASLAGSCDHFLLIDDG